eukprot:TRINITY_DN7229_c0_g2_i1.p1 TRINITY_DN7229_c0_g2~~TRINITY_DN7229_c0_g2_i1.p1  ORF type:complete len:661 (-),score=209.73 TRINITY_DN7229_c0_g2_i1:62-2044(-)
MSASTMNQADSQLAGGASEDESMLAFTSKLIYHLRFELVFLVGVLTLWAFGICSRSKKASNSATPKSRIAAPGTANAQRRSPAAGAALGEGAASRSRSSANTLEKSMPEEDQLRDAQWLLPKLRQLASTQAQRALQIYTAAVEAGLDVDNVPRMEREQFFMTLVSSLIRGGTTAPAVKLLQDLASGRSQLLTSELYTSTVKQLTAKHCFQECLKLHEVVSKANLLDIDKCVWSCLLFAAVEMRAFHRCTALFEKLRSCGTPSQRDYWNMVRSGASQGDWAFMVQLVDEMQGNGVPVDNVIYNTALDACVSANQMDVARKLLDKMDNVGGVSDVITYNTLMKGYAKQGNMESCFRLYDLMKERGFSPSQVTYGILLDGCINNNQVDEAAKVFDLMQSAACPMNTVLYTTLIKGFAREGKVEKAMQIYKQMKGAKGVAADLITYSILLKANCDADRLEAALQLLEEMLKTGVRPDEVIFNNLLSGCAKMENAELAKKLYKEMVNLGIKPSTATFSILIRLYSQCKLLDEACDMLRSEPAKHNVGIEPRLFSQLIQSCIRARQGRRATEIYSLMFEKSKPPMSMHSSILGMCTKLNMFETAADLLEVAARMGGRLDPQDVNAVLEGAIKKKKNLCADSCVASMKALGIPVSAGLKTKVFGGAS